MLLGAMRPRIDTLLVTIDTLLLHTRLRNASVKFLLVYKYYFMNNHGENIVMTGEESGLGGLDEPINLHVCITKIMKPLIVIVPVLVMFTIIYIQVIFTLIDNSIIQFTLFRKTFLKLTTLLMGMAP